MKENDVVTTGQDAADGPVTLSVIAPCYNEEANVDALADRTLTVLDEMAITAELVLVDDGSADRTWARITRRAEQDRRVRGARHLRNRGIEGAWRSGLDLSEGHLICLIDADLQNRPEDIPLLYKAYLREVPDMVQAVRHATGAARQRRLFSRALNVLLNLTFGMKLRDSKSGFLLARRDALANILRHRRDYRYFQSFVGAAAGVRGYLIAEVETVFDVRNAGKSFLSRFPVGVSLRIIWEVVKFRVETWQTTARRRALGRAAAPQAGYLAQAAGGEA